MEPLIDRWYAWPHLIPPATAARNITERHFKIMESYIGAPQIHANAVKNPKMAGGPFIDYDGKRVDEIRQLRDRTRRERSHIVALSSALAELDSLLCTAGGRSMHALYPKVPEILRGYVELTYDLQHHPSYRIIEPLLYRSPYYDRSMQSIMLSLTNGDDRPFVLSTPRLDGEGLVNLPWQFADKRIDELFRTKRDPKSWEELQSMFDVSGNEARAARTFFTPERPTPYQTYAGPGVRWRYFGHACILVEACGLSILFDPVLSYTYESRISRYTYDDLPDSIDYVLITHNHPDHILFETLLQIRDRVKHFIVPRNGPGGLADPSLRLMLENTGFSNVTEIGELEVLPIGDDIDVMGIPFFGEHADLAIRTKLAHLLRIGDVKLMFAADTCNIEPMVYKHLRREIGSVDVLFVGMECDGAPLTWLYGPLFSQRPERAMDESRRLNGSDFAQAVDIVNQLGCREIYVYAMGQEPWLNYIMTLRYTPESRPITESNRLIEHCRERGLTAERLFGEKQILIDRIALPGKAVTYALG